MKRILYTLLATAAVLVGGGGEGSSTSSNVMEGLLTLLLSERFGALAKEGQQAPRSPQADALCDAIHKDMEKKK